jgi:predicted flap endonuclease-1-like 5' DNA nuclease
MMSYLIESYWAWSLVSVACGCAVGYLWMWRMRRHAALAWAVVLLLVGPVVAALQLLPGRAGLYFDTLLLIAAAYFVGILLGGWLRRRTVSSEARAAGAVRAAEEARLAAEAKAAEEAREAAAAKAAEEARLAAEAKTAEEAREAAAAKAAEEARLAAEAKVAEEAREAAAAKAAEEARLAAEAKAADEAREAAAAKAAEEARLAAEAQAAEQAREAAAAKAAEEARLAAEAKAAEEAREAAAAKAAEEAGSVAEMKVAEVASAGSHPGVQPAGIPGPRDGKADDLKLIRGIGPKNERVCHDLGVYHLSQIADWTAEEAIWVGHHIAFPGRIEREHWIDQARLLASGGDTTYSAGIKAGTIAVDATADAPLDDVEAAALRAGLPAQALAVEGEAKHAGRRPYGLQSPRHGRADNLRLIRGIGPANERRLHELGIWHLDQIAAWSAENIMWIGSYLSFAGRIDRERWVAQAKDLIAKRDG